MARNQFGPRLAIILILVAFALVAVQRSTLAQTLPPQEDCYRKYRVYIPMIVRSPDETEQVQDLVRPDSGIVLAVNLQDTLYTPTGVLRMGYQ
jgi:hypothetical protein